MRSVFTTRVCGRPALAEQKRHAAAVGAELRVVGAHWKAAPKPPMARSSQTSKPGPDPETRCPLAKRDFLGRRVKQWVPPAAERHV